MFKFLPLIGLLTSILIVAAEEQKNAVPLGASANSTATSVVSPPSLATSPTNSSVPALKTPQIVKQELLEVLERIRIEPHAGDLANGSFATSVADIFTDNIETKEKSKALVADYDKALLEKARKWQSELSELRALYESRIIDELPQDKRDSAKKFIDASRTKWVAASARDANIRAEFLERMKRGLPSQPAGAKPGVTTNKVALPAQANADASTWMRDERIKAMRQDEESIKGLRELLSPDEAIRFDVRIHLKPAVAAKPPAPVASPIQSVSTPADKNRPLEAQKNDVPGTQNVNTKSQN